MFVHSDGHQLRELTQIIEAQHIVPAVDPTQFTLATVNQAQNYLATQHPKGKVIVTVD